MSILNTLFGLQRQRSLGWLLLHPDQKIHVRELARLTDTSAGSLHRELSRLAEVGLLIRSTQGNQVLYQANRASSVFPELAGLFRKTAGVTTVLRDAFAPLQQQIRFAFVFGSVARGEEQVHSDVDVLVIAELDFVTLLKALYPYQEELGREINPVLYSPEEFLLKAESRDPFIRELMDKPRLFVQGVDSDFREFAGDT